MSKKTFAESPDRGVCASCGQWKWHCLAIMTAAGALSWVCADCWKQQLAQLLSRRPEFGVTPAPSHVASRSEYEAWRRKQNEAAEHHKIQDGTSLIR